MLLVGRPFYAGDETISLIYQLSSCVAIKHLILILRDMEILFFGNDRSSCDENRRSVCKNKFKLFFYFFFPTEVETELICNLTVF